MAARAGSGLATWLGLAATAWPGEAALAWSGGAGDWAMTGIGATTTPSAARTPTSPVVVMRARIPHLPHGGRSARHIPSVRGPGCQ